MIWLGILGCVLALVILGWLVGTALAQDERQARVSEETVRKYRKQGNNRL